MEKQGKAWKGLQQEVPGSDGTKCAVDSSMIQTHLIPVDKELSQVILDQSNKQTNKQTNELKADPFTFSYCHFKSLFEAQARKIK